MAATEATRRNRNATRVNRTSDRRGAHAPQSVHRDETAADARPVTPALHLTPNVAIAARGAVRSAGPERRRTSPRSLRRFAV